MPLICSECPRPLPAQAPRERRTCSDACRGRRSRRLRSEARSRIIRDAADGLDVRDAARALLEGAPASLR